MDALDDENILGAEGEVVTIIFPRPLFEVELRNLNALPPQKPGHILIKQFDIHGPQTFKIILPMSGSAMATLAILAFMDMWNDYLLPLVLLSERSKFTLPLLLSTLSGQYKNQYNLTMAGALISIIPILIVYIFAQKYFKEGLTVGGVKG